MTETYVGTLCKRGHKHNGTEKSLRTKSKRECVECLKLARRRYVERHKERHKEHSKRSSKKWMENNRLEYLCRSLRCRCKKSALPFDLDAGFLESLLKKQDGLCYWLKIPINIEQHRKHPAKATLDRLVPQKGYIKGNVVWSSNFANRGRVDLPVAEFREFLELLS